MRNPSTYNGKAVYVVGTVTGQIQLQKNKLQSVLEAVGISETSDYELISIDDEFGELVALYSPSATGKRFLEGDYIGIYGDSMGLNEITYTNIFGTSSTVKMPQVKINYYYE